MGRPSGKVPTAPGGRLSWAPSVFLEGGPGALTVLLETNPCKGLLKEPQLRVSRGHRQATVESLPPADPPAEKGVPAPLWDGSLYAPSSRDTHTNPHKHTSPRTLPGSQNWGIPDRQGTLKMGGRGHWRRGCDAVNGRPQLRKHSQGHRASRGRALGCWGTLETGRLSDLSKVHQPNFSQLNPHLI